MERLTFEGNFCDIAQCRELPCLYNGACSQRKVWERLKAYEDTGLTPKEAKRMSNILMDVGIDYNCSWEYVKNWLLDDRLRELAEADKDGRVVVLPCKTVFELTWDAGPDCDLVCPVSIDGNGCCDFCDKGKLFAYERPCCQEHIERLGKTVFLTQDEAQKALEAMKDG